MLFSVWLFLLFVITPILSARILGVIPTPSYSHQIVFHPLWRELSLRGHQVTVLTTDPINDPLLTNLTEINLNFSYKTWNEKCGMVQMSKLSVFEFLEHTIEGGVYYIEEQFQHPAVQNLLKNETEKFDVVLIEFLFPAVIAFAGRFNSPLIPILSFDGVSHLYHIFGNPAHPVVNPEFLLGLPKKLNFLERLTSTLFYIFMKYYFCPRVLDAHQKLVNKYFTHQETLEELLDRSSVTILNTNPIFHQIRPLLPNIIQIGGGMHLTPPKPLPKDLKDTLDKAKNGVIYFSFGSNVENNLIPNQTLKVFLDTFAELPYTVLWKFEEDLPDKPKNVFIFNWFPQQDLLRHPNVKLFITQGGLQSIEEAVYNHVPIIGMPFLMDQQVNIQVIIEKGGGILLDCNSIDKDSFKDAIFEVINNPIYRTNIKELAELVADVPMSGLEKAVWWTEYVIRYNGAKHLRSPVLDLPSYQYYLLDVIAFCTLVILTISYVLIKLVKLVYNLSRKFMGYYKLKTL